MKAALQAEETARRKRDARSRTIVKRGELITATPLVKLDRAFLVRLHKQDPQLELHWHPILDRFLLYRRHGGGSHKKPDDLLVMEWDLDGQRPGWWLLDWLRWADKYAGGAVSPRAARRKYLNGLEEHEERRLAEWDKKRYNMSEDVAKHLKWCIDGRTSVVSDWGKRRYLK
jgi:hypothetical protein